MASIFGNWCAVVLYGAFFVSLVLGFGSPRGAWKRYRNIYAAWIVAFYVEMFGFPVTLYILASVFGVDLLELSDPRPLSLIIGSSNIQAISQSLVVAGVTLVVAGWATLYYARGAVTSQGLYGVFRHPQYLGLMLIATGLLINFPTIITIAMYPLLAVAYLRLAKEEEKQLKLNQDYSRVGRQGGKPSRIAIALLLSYMSFPIAVYFPGPSLFGVGLNQVISLVTIAALTGAYVARLRRSTNPANSEQ